MSHKCDDEEYKKRLKVKNLKVKNLCAKNLKANTAEINVADINSAVINTADITTLDVKNFSVNGQDLTCRLNTPAVIQETSTFTLGATGGVPPTNVNPDVYNCLIQNAILTRDDLQERVFQGRTFINQYLANFPCPPTCPPPPTEPVPLEIYGTLTLPIYERRFCRPGATGTTGTTGTTGVTGTGPHEDLLNTAVNFNLQVAYLLEEAQSIDARLVSVLVQLAYVDPLAPLGGCTVSSQNVVIDEIFIANRQFYPTLDVTYGENFANIISIPTDLLGIAYANSPLNSQGAIQMVIYKEQGLCIWTPEGTGFECLGGGAPVNNPQAGEQKQAAPQCPGGQVLCRSTGLAGQSFCAPCTNCPQPVGPCNVP